MRVLHSKLSLPTFLSQKQVFPFPEPWFKRLPGLKHPLLLRVHVPASLLRQTQLVGWMENHYSNHMTANMHGR